jgi:protein-S-isoprenylcysteine O-methyltransferase Ste14
LIDGVFHFSRNPMYLGFILIVLGVAMLLGTLSPWLVFPPFAWILSCFFVRREEMLLAETFGERWQAYKNVTRRWL